MSNYIKGTDFAVKDSLATENPAKIIRGSELNTEFNALQTAVSSKADTLSPVFSGTPTAPTPNVITNSTVLATTEYVQNLLITGSFLHLPAGSTAERGTPTRPAIRYNTSIAQFEVYNGTTWNIIAMGGGVRVTANDTTPENLATTLLAGTGISLVVENAGANENLRLNVDSTVFVPTGTVIDYCKSTPPTGFLKCDGSLLNRTTYANLYDVLGVAFGSTDSTNFRLPDLRGEFIRGWTDGSSVDSARVFGSKQDATEVATRVFQASVFSYTNEDAYRAGATISSAGEAGYSGAQAFISVRPRNVALLKCIKF
jgi:microcystin-dependent protein